MSNNERLLKESGIKQLENNSNKASKLLLILERSTNTLDIKKDGDGSYILEGIFGEIGVRNKNNRIYDENEYVPQIESLQEKIKNGKLLGELDHPQSFDISLKNVSHVIEDLYYDKQSKQVRGRVRLLNTSAGREAKALIDDGIPLHISSRAAGMVEANGHVKIKKLFTYDLVADPGFENAELKRVNESFGFSNDDNIQIFELDVPDSFDKYFNIKENKDIPNMEGLVKIEDFNKYSKYLTDQINSLKDQIKSLKESNSSTINDNDRQSQIAYLNKMAQKMNEMFSYLKYVAETLDHVISHNDSIVESVQQLQEYVDYVAEKADLGIQYTEEVAESVENSIRYAEHIGTRTNQIIDYNGYLAEHIDNLAQFGDSLAEGLDNVAMYTEYLKENIETIGQYSEYTTENINQIKAKLAAINEDDSAKEIEDKINKMGEPKQKSITGSEEEADETENKVKDKIAEIKNETDSYKNTILEKLDLLVESAKKQTVDYDGDLHFLRFVNESKRNEFKSLNENQKLDLIQAFKDKNYISSREVESIWENVIRPQAKKLDFVENMPNEYREAWEKASLDTKKRIIGEAQYHDLSNQYLIERFWSTRDFRDTQVEVEKVNESASFETASNGYNADSDYLNYFKNALQRRFGKF